MRSRKPPATPFISAQLEDARQRMEHWRRTRNRRSRIPERLWASAVKLANKCGLNKTARTLRLNYYQLKKRLESFAPEPRSGSEAGPSFMELVSPQAVCECVVEFEDASGTKMRIHLKSPEIPDLVGLSTAFWSTKA